MFLTAIPGHLISLLQIQLEVKFLRLLRSDQESPNLSITPSRTPCHPLCHGRARLMREDGAYFGKTKKAWLFGLKLHTLRHVDRRVVSLILMPANWDDHVPAPDLLMAADGGITIGDLGYRCKKFQGLLIEWTETLTLPRAGAAGPIRLLSQIRQKTETTFSQLWFKLIDRVFSPTWFGL